MSLQGVEFIRQYIANRSLASLRIYVSQIAGNQQAIEIMRKPEFAAAVIGFVLQRLGHTEATVAGDKPTSRTMQSVQKTMRVKGARAARSGEPIE